jgi:hypothetical protein
MCPIGVIGALGEYRCHVGRPVAAAGLPGGWAAGAGSQGSLGGRLLVA